MSDSDINCPRCESYSFHKLDSEPNFLQGYVGSKVFGPLGWSAAYINTEQDIFQCQDCGCRFVKEIEQEESSQYSLLTVMISSAVKAFILLMLLGLFLLILNFLMTL